MVTNEQQKIILVQKRIFQKSNFFEECTAAATGKSLTIPIILHVLY